MATRIFPALAFVAVLGGCAWAPGPALDSSRLHDDIGAKTGTEAYPVQLINSAVISRQIDAVATTNSQVTPATGADLAQSIAKYEYRIGPQDLLGVTVLYNPQLSSSAANMQPIPIAPGAADGAQQQAPLEQNGFRVGANGEVYYPPVGMLRVGGKTVEQVRSMISTALSKEIRDPRVDVRVVSYRNSRIDVTGLVKNPGSLQVTDVPLSMINAIARTGGTLPDADVQKVRLTRGDKVYELDLDTLTERRNGVGDFLLQGGDIINVPDRLSSRIFVMGEVVKPTSLLMNKGRLTLADALAGVNSIDIRAADPRQVFVIRGARENPTQPAVYRLDMTQVDALLLSTQFRMEPLDVVYVGTSDAVRFNRVLEQITPTIQTLFFTKQLGK
ncbi:polysaccharide biosynthesis/export family protein [Cupriavidus basilensis]|uniref:polysaccharide biosynthesis/export family protein n=1 Tax=Cupriavidus basilensis TaxID=68895 RepID=UPI0020A6CE41|nr:polysaccharide biosynthesis/export family protein [Cupriavidus basilensis]MCP3019821.1 polysaccharide biosynthesis/export family protein [Cupriavidus basilensis]MDR3380619.1 polysaccharide biosynthesis/export family protein [Cupriavidus basilensis]